MAIVWYVSKAKTRTHCAPQEDRYTQVEVVVVADMIENLSQFDELEGFLYRAIHGV